MIGLALPSFHISGNRNNLFYQKCSGHDWIKSTSAMDNRVSVAQKYSLHVARGCGWVVASMLSIPNKPNTNSSTPT
jgi:hypothetical protein